VTATDTISSTELLKLAPGVTYRQLDYWRRIGAIVPADGCSEPGSGYRSRWSPRDAQRLRAVASFMAAVQPGPDRRQMSTDIAHFIWQGLEQADTVEFGNDLTRITVSVAP
jgi:hypothetical protein